MGEKHVGARRAGRPGRPVGGATRSPLPLRGLARPPLGQFVLPGQPTRLPLAQPPPGPRQRPQTSRATAGSTLGRIPQCSLDRVKISVHAGDGGDSGATFHHEAHVPPAGPRWRRRRAWRLNPSPGRSGPRTTLRDFQPTTASRLDPVAAAALRKHHGKAGTDLTWSFRREPAVYDDASGELLADLLKRAIRSRWSLAAGGGGRGNAPRQAATHQAPRHAQKGEPGDERWIRLEELRLIAGRWARSDCLMPRQIDPPGGAHRGPAEDRRLTVPTLRAQPRCGPRPRRRRRRQR